MYNYIINHYYCFYWYIYLFIDYSTIFSPFAVKSARAFEVLPGQIAFVLFHLIFSAQVNIVGNTFAMHSSVFRALHVAYKM